MNRTFASLAGLVAFALSACGTTSQAPSRPDTGRPIPITASSTADCSPPKDNSWCPAPTVLHMTAFTLTLGEGWFRNGPDSSMLISLTRLQRGESFAKVELFDVSVNISIDPNKSPGKILDDWLRDSDYINLQPVDVQPPLGFTAAGYTFTGPVDTERSFGILMIAGKKGLYILGRTWAGTFDQGSYKLLARQVMQSVRVKQ